MALVNNNVASLFTTVEAAMEEEEVEEEEELFDCCCCCCGSKPVARNASIPRFGLALKVLAQLCKSLFFRRFDRRISSSEQNGLVERSETSTASSLCSEFKRASKHAAARSFIDSGNGGTRAPLSRPILLMEELEYAEDELGPPLLLLLLLLLLLADPLLLLFEAPSAVEWRV